MSHKIELDDTQVQICDPLSFIEMGGETTQKPVKGALGNRESKCTDQRLAVIRSVQVELMW